MSPTYVPIHKLTDCVKDSKVVYRRYASLFFIAGCASDDNELITLEIVHRYVEQMDKYYGNVCELDIIFNFQKAYFILDELLLAGEMQESSKKNVLRCIGQQDSLEDMEVRISISAHSLSLRAFSAHAAVASNTRRGFSSQPTPLPPIWHLPSRTHTHAGRRRSRHAHHVEAVFQQYCRLHGRFSSLQHSQHFMALHRKTGVTGGFCDLHSDNDTTTCALLAIQTSVPRLRQGFRVLDLLLNYNDHPTMPFLVQALGVTLLRLLLPSVPLFLASCSH